MRESCVHMPVAPKRSDRTHMPAQLVDDGGSARIRRACVAPVAERTEFGHASPRKPRLDAPDQMEGGPQGGTTGDSRSGWQGTRP
jgi:hypothetical protein